MTNRAIRFLGIATGFAIGVSVVGCQSTPEQAQANQEAKARAIAANEAIQNDPTASPSVKAQAKKLADVASASVTEGGEIDPVATITTVGGFLPPPWNSVVLLAMPFVGLAVQRMRAAKAAKPTTPTT